MKVLLVSATFPEIQPFVQHFKMNVVQTNVFSCKNNSFSLNCLVTEPGMVATSCVLSRFLVYNHFDLIVNVGIAGSYNPRFTIGSVVQITNEIMGDFGIDNRGTFKTVFEEGLQSADDFPFENGKLINPHASELFKDLPKCSGITVNTVTGSNTRKEFFTRKFKPDIETMEGAAFFYTCLLQSQKFAEIRAISNMVEPRNKENWNIPLAISNLNTTLIHIFS